MSEHLVGNLVADPELRFTANGNAVTNLRVASTPRIKQDDKWVDGETTYQDVVVWRDQAQHAADNLRKGDRVVAVGYLKDRSWTTDDGEKKSKREFVTDDIGPSLKFKDLGQIVHGQ